MRDPDNVAPGEVVGKTMLIVGYGGTGAATARLAQAFGMRVLGLRRSAGALGEAAPLEWLAPGESIIKCQYSSECAQ